MLLPADVVRIHPAGPWLPTGQPRAEPACESAAKSLRGTDSTKVLAAVLAARQRVVALPPREMGRFSNKETADAPTTKKLDCYSPMTVRRVCQDDKTKEL